VCISVESSSVLLARFFWRIHHTLFVSFLYVEAPKDCGGTTSQLSTQTSGEDSRVFSKRRNVASSDTALFWSSYLD